MVSAPAGLRVGSYSVVQCVAGYALPDGSRVRSLYCTDSGQWHVQPEDCVGELEDCVLIVRGNKHIVTLLSVRVCGGGMIVTR